MNIISFHGNWIDLVIIAIILYLISEGFRLGFFSALFDFVSFFLSLALSLLGFSYVSAILTSAFSISPPLANLISFLGISVIAGSISSVLGNFVISLIPQKYHNFKFERFLSVIPSIGEGIIICAFIISIVINLPINPYYKDLVAQSQIGGLVMENTSALNDRINSVFGKAIEETLTHLVISPNSKDVVSLTVASRKLSEDIESGFTMYGLVNNARRLNGVPELIWDEKLKEVGKDYAFDMWNRSFFGHYSPEGESVANRLEKANIKYKFAGENLALAPSVTIAETGLMNSEGHRHNILDPSFKKIGIGVVDNASYGKIFVQVFSD